MSTKEVNVEALYPGEPVLVQEALEKHLRSLKSGGKPEPVVIAPRTAGDGFHVTDGSNRVRAHLEFFKDAKVLPPLECTERLAKLSVDYRNELELLARTLGKGASAFLELPVVPEDDYHEAQAQVLRRIRDGDGAQS